MVKRDCLINFVVSSVIKSTSRHQSALALGFVFCCLGVVYVKDDISLAVDDSVKSSVYPYLYGFMYYKKFTCGQ